jgi:OOP family OmpA-OmpF porin
MNDDPRKAVRWYSLASLVLFCILVGCAAERVPVIFAAFEPEDLNEKLAAGDYSSKVDNLLVIVDTSATMNKRYLYEAFETNITPSLLDVELEILRQFNQTIPEIELKAGIRTYGFGSCQSWGFTVERLKLGPYKKESFDRALDSIECAGGGSPLDYALDQASVDMESLEGQTAIIVFSDGGARLDKDAYWALDELKKAHPDRVCVHTISLGKNRGMLAGAGKCGYAGTAEAISTASGMAEFVEKVFLKRNRRRF